MLLTQIQIRYIKMIQNTQLFSVIFFRFMQNLIKIFNSLKYLLYKNLFILMYNFLLRDLFNNSNAIHFKIFAYLDKSKVKISISLIRLIIPGAYRIPPQNF